MTDPWYAEIVIRVVGEEILVSSSPEVCQRLGMLFRCKRIPYAWDTAEDAARLAASARLAVEREAHRCQIPVTVVGAGGEPYTAPDDWVVTFARASARKAAGSHDVAWLSGEGWFCACPAGTRCPAIKAVREALSVAARPTKARKTRATRGESA